MANKYHTVVEPVADLRKVPDGAVHAFSHRKDDFLLSQLLFGEKVILIDESQGWALVEAVEQQTFRPLGRWEGYRGWVRMEFIRPCRTEDGAGGIVKTRTAPVFADPSEESVTLFELSVGTRITADDTSVKSRMYCAITLADGTNGWVEVERLRMAGFRQAEDQDRESMLATALLFLGTPYLWGGRSMYMPALRTATTGVDCSGLVNLVYRAHGIDIPRDAHEQWMKAQPVPGGELKPCDLIFAARGDDAVSHVMLFAGGETFIEAHETGEEVKITTYSERFGLDIAGIAQCDHVCLEDGRKVSFGRLLP